MMKDDFAPYNMAVKLKEKGFYYRCVATYDKDGMLGYNYVQPASAHTISFDDCLFSNNVEDNECIDAPTISQVLKWLREEKKLLVSPSLFRDGYEPYVQSAIFEDGKDYTETWRVKGFHQTYEEAVVAGIEYVLDNLCESAVGEELLKSL